MSCDRASTVVGFLFVAVMSLALGAGCKSTEADPDTSEEPTASAPEDQEPAPRALKTTRLEDVAGYGSKRDDGPALGDVCYSLYDVGRGQKGVSRATIHVFPESSKRFKKLIVNDQDVVSKRIPDEDMQEFLAYADDSGFAKLLRPMSPEAIDRAYREGSSVITLEDYRGGKSRVLAAVRPRVAQGASEDDVQTFQNMKRGFMEIARAYVTPTLIGSSDPRGR